MNNAFEKISLKKKIKAGDIENIYQTIANRIGEDVSSKLIPTGLQDIDRIIGGYEKGNINLICALQSMGKTALTMSIVMNMMTQNESLKCNWFTIDENADSTVNKIIANTEVFTLRQLFLDIYNFNHEQIEQFNKLKHSLLHNLKNRMTVIEHESCTDNIINICKHNTPDIIVVDYGQQLDISNPNIRSTALELATFKLKKLASETNAIVIIILQLKQQSDTTNKAKIYKPQMADIKDSSAFAQLCDTCMAISREQYFHSKRPDMKELNMVKVQNNIADIAVLKSKKTDTGNACVKFLPQFGKFINIDLDDISE